MIEIAFFLLASGIIYYLLKDHSQIVEKENIIQETFEPPISVEPLQIKSPNIESLIGKAERLFGAQAYRNAEKVYIEAVKIDPRDPRPYKGLSKIYLKGGEEDDAISSLEKACELDPKDDKSFNNLGTLYFKRKEFNKAIGAYEQAISLSREIKVHRLFNLALVLIEVKQFERAASVLEKASKKEPTADIYKKLIEVYKSLTDEVGQRRTYKRLLEVEPGNSEAKRELAKVE